jgi:hypothetical protein
MIEMLLMGKKPDICRAFMAQKFNNGCGRKRKVDLADSESNRINKWMTLNIPVMSQTLVLFIFGVSGCLICGRFTCGHD